MREIETKICKGCKESKIIHEYSVNRRNFTQLSNYCKSCIKIRRKPDLNKELTDRMGRSPFAYSPAVAQKTSS